MKRIGVVDTTFARADMGGEAVRTLRSIGTGFRVMRRTVPGIKDLPVACKKLFDEEGCDLVMALGMPGAQPIDKMCAHEATQGIQQVQLLTNRHILEVFVHEDEATDAPSLHHLLLQRTRDHCQNAYDLLFRPHALTARAGTGVRQGYPSVGSAAAPAPRPAPASSAGRTPTVQSGASTGSGH